MIPPALQARVLGEPELAQRLLAIKSNLAPEEVTTLMAVLGGSPEAQQSAFLEQIKELSVENAIAFCREAASALRDQASNERSGNS